MLFKHTPSLHTDIAIPYINTHRKPHRYGHNNIFHKIISYIRRFSRKRTYICTSLVSENRMARIISPQAGFHQEYFTKHIVMFEK